VRVRVRVRVREREDKTDSVSQVSLTRSLRNSRSNTCVLRDKNKIAADAQTDRWPQKSKI